MHLHYWHLAFINITRITFCVHAVYLCSWMWCNSEVKSSLLYYTA
uniref:Uncharacterized protein n=1 Tax=Anguilla anguilla TaxID=7936 RepID=A0A0E9VFH4_ANGAN